MQGARRDTPGKGLGSLQLRKLGKLLLSSPDFEETLRKLDSPPERLISPLLSLLFETDELTRWRAVRAVAITVSAMERTSIASAREIMRRLIWSLNDESGGIGWGAPEAMGEIMAESEALANEYYRILISYIDEQGNLLENDQLERGVLSGIGRLAQSRPALVQEWIDPILRQLSSRDAVKRGLAVHILGFLKLDRELVEGPLSSLLQDEEEVAIYQDDEVRAYKVCDLASELLARVGVPGGKEGLRPE